MFADKVFRYKNDTIQLLRVANLKFNIVVVKTCLVYGHTFVPYSIMEQIVTVDKYSFVNNHKLICVLCRILVFKPAVTFTK